MDAVQRLRARADAQNTLKTTQSTEGHEADPGGQAGHRDRACAARYRLRSLLQPTTIYGSWPYPTYPPYYYPQPLLVPGHFGGRRDRFWPWCCGWRGLGWRLRLGQQQRRHQSNRQHQQRQQPLSAQRRASRRRSLQQFASRDRNSARATVAARSSEWTSAVATVSRCSAIAVGTVATWVIVATSAIVIGRSWQRRRSWRQPAERGQPWRQPAGRRGRQQAESRGAGNGQAPEPAIVPALRSDRPAVVVAGSAMSVRAATRWRMPIVAVPAWQGFRRRRRRFAGGGGGGFRGRLAAAASAAAAVAGGGGVAVAADGARTRR